MPHLLRRPPASSTPLPLYLASCRRREPSGTRTDQNEACRGVRVYVYVYVVCVCGAGGWQGAVWAAKRYENILACPSSQRNVKLGD